MLCGDRGSKVSLPLLLDVNSNGVVAGYSQKDDLHL